MAIAPSSGKILAMASVPSFDPNRLASHRFGEVAKAAQEPRCRQERTPPQPRHRQAAPSRSTFKLVTAAAAIESGDYDADSKVPGVRPTSCR